MRTLTEANLNSRDRAAIEAAAAALRMSLPVDRVVLFGSKARGDDRPDSDIDLLVITSRPLTEREADSVVALLSPIQLERGVLFSTIEVSREEWDRGVYRVLPLRREVDRDGVAA